MRNILLMIILIIVFIPFNLKAQSEQKLAINALEKIVLGGAKQWIQIRGTNPNNPILLFLHGGPGFTEMPNSHIDSKKLEEHFIVVNWDQRGAGKSFNENINPATMNIEQFLSDTEELIRLLLNRFSQNKVFIIGHSWGSVLGLYTVYRHPELIHAYIGMGQVINFIEGEKISYQYTLEQAKTGNDSVAIKTLLEIGNPPYKDGFQSLYKQREFLGKYGGALTNMNYSDLMSLRAQATCYSEPEQHNVMRGLGFSCSLLWNELMKVNYMNEIKELEVPVYFFVGKNDYQTPFVLVVQYYKILKAPYKEIIWFEKSAHMPNLEEPEVYQKKLIDIALTYKLNQ